MANIDIQQIKQRFGIVGNAPGLNRAIDIAVQIAPTDISALITGESGVGKERFPQIIHQFSQRKHGQYIVVNCGAIPEGTIDSELFGHEKGSFTSALNDRKGYFEVADHGTIFLDEVGELPLSTQARLLRVLESGDFMRVGSSKAQKTDVRIIAATNLNMLQAVADGRFREDLYYRLNAATIHVPPLRERPEDILLLFRKFASDFAEKYRMPTLQLLDDAKKMLIEYYWPGNIRQLRNITEQISVIETTRELSGEILKLYLPKNENERLPAIFKSNKDQGQTFSNEREILYQVLFDMRKEINDLREMLHGILHGEINTPEKNADLLTTSSEHIATANIPSPLHHFDNHSKEKHEILDVDVYEEDESFSLEEVEKEMIRKALIRHGGKRKNAALDLKISERTLYRKIKEYDLE